MSIDPRNRLIYVYEDTVYDDNGYEVSPLDDDYYYWKSEQDNLNNPLSDDYCKYDHD